MHSKPNFRNICTVQYVCTYNNNYPHICIVRASQVEVIITCILKIIGIPMKCQTEYNINTIAFVTYGGRGWPECVVVV